jgi:hypothetical protein
MGASNISFPTIWTVEAEVKGGAQVILDGNGS